MCLPRLLALLLSVYVDGHAACGLCCVVCDDMMCIGCVIGYVNLLVLWCLYSDAVCGVMC